MNSLILGLAMGNETIAHLAEMKTSQERDPEIWLYPFEESVLPIRT